MQDDYPANISGRVLTMFSLEKRMKTETMLH